MVNIAISIGIILYVIWLISIKFWCIVRNAIKICIKTVCQGLERLYLQFREIGAFYFIFLNQIWCMKKQNHTLQSLVQSLPYSMVIVSQQ